MKRFLLSLSVSFLTLCALGQSAPVRTLDTRADLIARVSTAGETIAVRNFATNVAWPAPRTFVEYSTTVITNANDGVHYITNARPGSIYVSNDRFAAEQDASWWGAVGNSVTDDTVALNAASEYTARYIDQSVYTTLNGPGRGFLRIRPTTTGYLVTSTIYLQSSTEASGAAIIYRGQKTNSLALAVGPSDYKNVNINNHVFNLPDVWGYNDGFSAAGSIGVSLRSIGRSTIRIGYVYRFETGIQLLGDTTGYLALNSIDGGRTDACRWSATLLATNSGFVNGNTWNGVVLNNENGNFAPGHDTGYELILIDGTDGSINGNTWQGGSFEGFPGQRVIHILNASANLFIGQRLEHHVGDYTNVVASKLYMESESTVSGRGLNNRFMWPSQGVNGMAGIMVKETGASATGNSGGSSDWQEFRSSDTGDYHGPLVLTSSSSTSQGYGHLTVYPYMAWPDTHFSQYQKWVSMLTGNGMYFKEQTDTAAKLYIFSNGDIIQSAGTGYLPRAILSGGSLTGYDDSQVRRIVFNRYGSLQWYTNRIYLDGANSVTTNEVVATIRPNFGSSFGGMVLTDMPTNRMVGFSFGQRLTVSDTNNNAHYAFPGMQLQSAGPGNDYVYIAHGIFGPDFPLESMTNRPGFYVESGGTNPYGSGPFTFKLRPEPMNFEVWRGTNSDASFRVDYSKTAGDSSLSAWLVDSNAPVKIRHDNIAKLLYTGGSLNTNVSALAALGAGSAGNVLSYVSPTSFAWSNAPSSFSFSDLTNAVLMGANMSAVYTSSNMTISSSGGGGATNGTAVSVDGAAALSFANFADSSKVGFSASGSNVTATIVADSLALADIGATTEAHFLNRTNHTGTQNWTTLHSTPTTLSGYGITDAQPLDASLTQIATATWVSGDFVYHDGTNLTNFVSTAAGRTLMAAVDAAAQRTALSITNYQGGIGVQLTGTNFSHNVAAGTNIVLTTNGNQLVINTPGGGSGTAVLVNGTNVSNPNFRRFFGITDVTNVDLLLSAGANITFTTNSGVLEISGASGSGDIRTTTATSADYNATDSDSVIRVNAVSANVTITLPASPSDGRLYTVMKTGGIWDVIVDDGTTTYTMDTAGQSITIIYMTGYGYFSFGVQGGTASLTSLQVNGTSGVTNLVNSATATWTKTNGTAAVNIATVSTGGVGLAPQITSSNAVFTSSATGVPEWTPNRVTKTIATFRAQQGEPPTSFYAKFSTRNGIGTLLYDPTSFTSSRFRWMVPEGYNLTNVTIVVKWTTSATSGDGTWVAKNAKLTGDIDSLSFGTPVTNTVTTSGTAGTVMTSTLSGVTVSSPAAGDWIYTDIARIDDSINAADLELHAVEVRAE